jgi:very-short-patch-repair endonuclease
LPNVYVEAGGISWELDRFWPEDKVAVEVDGRNYHEAIKDRDKDEIKRAKLLTVGITVLHIADWRVQYGIGDALDDLEAILRLSRERAV